MSNETATPQVDSEMTATQPSTAPPAAETEGEVYFIPTQVGSIVVPGPGFVLSMSDGDVRVVRVDFDGPATDVADQAKFFLGSEEFAFEVLVVPVNATDTTATVMGSSNPGTVEVGTEIQVPNAFWITWIEVQIALGNKWWE